MSGIDRRIEEYAGSTLVETSFRDLTWDEIRSTRNRCLTDSDNWMLTDRYAALTSSQQTELTEYRQALRDICDTQDPDNADLDAGANAAADAFPDVPVFMLDP